MWASFPAAVTFSKVSIHLFRRFRLAVLVYNQMLRPGLQDPQGLQKLNHRVALGITQSKKRLRGSGCLSRMRHHRLAHGGIQPMVSEGMLIRYSPQLARNELAVSGEESYGPGRLLHVNRFHIEIREPMGDVVKLEIRESGNPDYTVSIRFQARLGQFFTGQIDFQGWGFLTLRLPGGL